MVRIIRSIAQRLARRISALFGRLSNTSQHHEPEDLPTPPVADDKAAEPAEPHAPKPAAPKPKPKRKPKTANPAPPAEVVTPKCPHCRKPMVIKTARTGRNAGEFWGCADYPQCRGIRPIFRTSRHE